MSWIYLILAGLSEIGFAIFLKMSNQFTKLLPSISFIIFGAISFYLMSKAIKEISMPVVYAVWTGIGVAGVYFVEMMFFDEPFTVIKMFFVLLIVIGILGLKMV